MVVRDNLEEFVHIHGPVLPEYFPKVVCLVGSSRFKHQFHEVAASLEKQGILILMMGFFQHTDGVPVSNEERQVLEKVDQSRIDLCDEVLVINGLLNIHRGCGGVTQYHSAHVEMGRRWSCTRCGKHFPMDEVDDPKPYVGESTQKEIDYAKSINTPVRYLNPVE